MPSKTDFFKSGLGPLKLHYTSAPYSGGRGSYSGNLILKGLNLTALPSKRNVNQKSINKMYRGPVADMEGIRIL